MSIDTDRGSTAGNSGPRHVQVTPLRHSSSSVTMERVRAHLHLVEARIDLYRRQRNTAVEDAQKKLDIVNDLYMEKDSLGCDLKERLRHFLDTKECFAELIENVHERRKAKGIAHRAISRFSSFSFEISQNQRLAEGLRDLIFGTGDLSRATEDCAKAKHEHDLEQQQANLDHLHELEFLFDEESQIWYDSTIEALNDYKPITSFPTPPAAYKQPCQCGSKFNNPLAPACRCSVDKAFESILDLDLEAEIQRWQPDRFSASPEHQEMAREIVAVLKAKLEEECDSGPALVDFGQKVQPRRASIGETY